MNGRSTTSDVLDVRALNRATLARQSLLERSSATPAEMIAQLVGMQAQAPMPPYFGLWSRLTDFVPDQLATLLLERQVVRIVLMRGTVHLVTADDALMLRPLVQPIMDADLWGNPQRTPQLRGVDLDALGSSARRLVEERPRPNAELARLLAEHWPQAAPTALAYAARNLLALVQVPPRGVWGRSGQPTFTTAEAWLGRGLDPAPSIDDVALRYLAAFGPASVGDFQVWYGLTRMREVFDRLRPRLRTFTDPEGRELVDLPDAPRPGGDVAAPPRFLPSFDNLLRSHAVRTRVIGDDARRAIATPNGVEPGTFLLDGFVAGTWRLDQKRGRATLVIEPFAPVSAADRSALEGEGAALVEFAAPDADARDVHVAQPA